MSSRKWLVGSLVSLGVVCLVAVPVYAYGHKEKDAASAKQIITKLDDAKTSLVKAIEVAEKESKGKAVQAVCELDKDGNLHVDVHCVVGDTLMALKVDTRAGKVTSTKEVKDTGDVGH